MGRRGGGRRVIVSLDVVQSARLPYVRSIALSLCYTCLSKGYSSRRYMGTYSSWEGGIYCEPETRVTARVSQL